MNITLRQLIKVAFPKPISQFKITSNSWRIFTYHSDNFCFFEKLKELRMSDKQHKKTYMLLFVQLGKRCESGCPLQEVFDEKTLHESCEFAYKDKVGVDHKEKIFRIRRDDLRLYFIYNPPYKEIILLDILVKKKDKLSKGEVEHLQNLARSIRNCNLSSDSPDKNIMQYLEG